MACTESTARLRNALLKNSMPDIARVRSPSVERRTYLFLNNIRIKLYYIILLHNTIILDQNVLQFDIIIVRIKILYFIVKTIILKVIILTVLLYFMKQGFCIIIKIHSSS